MSGLGKVFASAPLPALPTLRTFGSYFGLLQSSYTSISHYERGNSDLPQGVVMKPILFLNIVENFIDITCNGYGST